MTNIRHAAPAGAGEPEGGRVTDGRVELSTYLDDTISPMSCQVYTAAELLHTAGLCVIPLREQSKEPAITSWKEYQSRRPDASERWDWWGEHPRRNLAVVCGAVSGNGAGKSLAVLDFDDPAAFNVFAAEHPEIITSTWVARTGKGGTHVYLFVRGAVPTGRIAGGDLKAEGGYVVAPPSVHPNGEPYQWYHQAASILEIADLAALGIIEAKTAKGPAPAIEDKIAHGKRSTTLTSLAGTMRRRGMTETEITAALLAVNDERCEPPLERAEVEAIAQSVAKYAPATTLATEPGKATVGHNLTDLGNARRLVDLHGDDLRFSYPWGRWLCWDGTRWKVDDTGEVHRRAKAAVGTIYAEASKAVDDDARKAIGKHALRSEADNRLRAMMNLAQSEPRIPVLPDELDINRWLLNLENGTLDLRTATLEPHQREDLISKRAPVSYDPGARCPMWLDFLDRIMAGNSDLIAFLQRAVGYALTGDISERCLFILYGTGANGKSTFLTVVSALLGADYAQQTPTDTLLIRGWGASIPNDVARLRGARLVTALESEEGRRLAEALVKGMTGGDKLAARFLRAEWFEFVPEFKIFLATNHKPEVRGSDEALWDRLRLIPFNVTIPEHEQDKHLAEKLQEELPGILCWALDGCLAWQRDGLGEPAEVKRATANYRAEMDVIAGFIEDCCHLSPIAVASKGELYDAYGKWCENSGEAALSKRLFCARIRERGFDDRRGTGGAHQWIGVGLRA